jgi:hypothetical protein
MRQFLTGVAKFLTILFSILFVITAVLSLLLYNTGQHLFNPRLYKNALTNQNDYERLPGIISMMLTTGQTSLDGIAGGMGMPPFMSNLQASDLENIITTLLPPSDLQAMTEKTIDGLFAYLNGESDSVTISLVGLKARLAGPPGTQAIQRLILFQPPCTLEELAQISGEIGSDSAGMVLCNPGEDLNNIVLPKVQEQLNAVITTIPDHATIIKPAPPAAAFSNPGPFGINNDPIGVLILMRMIVRLSPFLPLACLMLVTLFGVRSLKGWMRWWVFRSSSQGQSR